MMRKLNQKDIRLMDYADNVIMSVEEEFDGTCITVRRAVQRAVQRAVWRLCVHVIVDMLEDEEEEIKLPAKKPLFKVKI